MSYNPPTERMRDFMGKRIRVRAVFSKHGNGVEGTNLKPKLCFQDLRLADSGKFLKDHAWVNNTVKLHELSLSPGDIVELDARVGEYTRQNGTEGYNLSYPTKICKVGHDDGFVPHWKRFHSRRPYNNGGNNNGGMMTLVLKDFI